jgi:UDP-glucose:(heptosyl)LPS alpha-1,3-glucosyltransferase
MKIMLAVSQLHKQGGKERDCIAIARHLVGRGHDVKILTMSDNVAGLEDLQLVKLAVRGFANHTRARRFAKAVLERKLRERPDAVLAFERIPGADFFYAADGAAILQESRLLSWPPRRRTRWALERGVFADPVDTHIFFLTERQRDEYIIAYDFAPSRATVLPMILHDDRYEAARKLQPGKWRAQLGIAADAPLAVSVALNPKLKGVDRSLNALRHFPHLQLIVAGSDSDWLRRRVERLKLAGRVHIVPYVAEVIELIADADFLLHPARLEAAGQVIGEALLAGVPALVSGACGYAGEVAKSGAGLVPPEPFTQQALVTGIATMIGSLAEMRQAAAEQAAQLQQHRGRWLSVIAERIERRA